MTSPRLGLHRLTDENETDVERLLHQYGKKPSFPLRILREKEIDETVRSLRRNVFCRVLVSEGDVLGAVVAGKSAWDSNHFGFGIGKIRRVVVSDALKRQHAVRAREALIESCMKWMKQNQVKCLIARADLDNVEDILAYDKNDFQLADVLVIFHRDVEAPNPALDSPPSESATIRPSRPEDVGTLMEIARASFAKDHFHRDPNFPQDKSDELFARWIHNSCHGSATTVLVAAEKNQEPCGFIACKTEQLEREPKYGVIDLIAVSPLSQGRGIGTQLVTEAVRWFAANVESIFVGTQANNIPSIRTYEKVGFRLLDTQLTLHKWF